MWPNPQFPADLVTFTEETLMANFNFSAIIRSENQKFPTLNVRKKLSSSEKVVVQLQHEILSLNKIVDDTTNKSKTLENLLQKTYHTEKQLYEEIQLIEDELTKSDANIMVLTNKHHDVSEKMSVNKSPAKAEEKQLINSEKIRSSLQIK